MSSTSTTEAPDDEEPLPKKKKATPKAKPAPKTKPTKAVKKTKKITSPSPAAATPVAKLTSSFEAQVRRLIITSINDTINSAIKETIRDAVDTAITNTLQSALLPCLDLVEPLMNYTRAHSVLDGPQHDDVESVQETVREAVAKLKTKWSLDVDEVKFGAVPVPPHLKSYRFARAWGMGGGHFVGWLDERGDDKRD
ncbi:hypothetical protein EKO04_000713 [Ascochyta lentis]|uniref:Uncharacterized protein n=1 Tax=Ascochyta lentis TaxID=205686 RepID=A0A8H7MMW6_9PLEO|nr:hypothetical protein EKO04_000713 [Ascochyta lentis]